MQSMPLPVSTIGKQRLMMSANCFGVRLCPWWCRCGIP
ncbi:hypothetical protein AC35_0628 [Escherichia coli 3-475-03_S3_C2]|uniref:Uncharacterized protein n=3 Tax=Enterobacteriaceae TaxID=543 RepID=A0A6N3R3U6_SHIFL|nr:hypothetical protein FORC28_0661 [Escherichia coli]EDV60568.1 hypothetical protein EcB7A_1439 [Escherichia coli B7A]EFU97835.1 hypothetical protein EC3431_2687 [Escherichia coli 3431]EGJ03788.1 hypothetical protein SB359474_0151 [Shigella boydii 3594-74]EGW68655.1 hypothetical protein ECSTECB2F1_3450 [Escherichia coli O91:H21 str. B2F1]EHW08554.1 hypothetical protein ECDEC8B_3999 [Escherichia coli DEC8B]EHW88580.1 hypothetical protein ECDEC10F_4736 [Escherichia coli DEC10F]EHX57606.1 hypo